MGEPVEVVECSDSEISRLFPKCRPRSSFAAPRYYPASDSRTLKSNAIYTQAHARTHANLTNLSDLNRNVVVRESDDNDNYEELPTAIPTTIDEEVTSLGDDRSGSSASRMSVDSASATPSSHSSQSSHTHSIGGPPDRNADLEADLSVVSAYRDLDDRFTSILDSSYEDSSGQRVISPSVTPHQVPLAHHIVPQAPSHSVPQGRRDHFRLRDSRIEAAGGREVFSQSRSRPSRRRHDESRRSHHHPHHYHHHSHYPNYPQPHHPIQQQQQQLQQQPQQPQQPPPQLPPQAPQLTRDDVRRRESSSSRSNSTSSNSSSASGSRSSESREVPGDERLPTSASSAIGSNTSALVYETRLTGSSEVVFDDISDWVARGLTVRGVEPKENIRRNPKKGFVGIEQFPTIPVTSPTPPSRSPSQSEHESDYGEEGDSPIPVTKIGNVPIAEYEGSPRRYGQPQRPPRPGFPRRVVSQEEGRSRSSKIAQERESKTNNNHVTSGRDKPRPHLLPAGDVQKVQIHSNSHSSNQKPVLDIPDIKLHSHEDTTVVSATQVDEPPAVNYNSKKVVEKSLSRSEDRSGDESEGSLPSNPISISTLTSSYASTFSQIQSTEICEPPPLPSLPEIYEGYGFEDSETRKVLEEFFLDSGKKRGRQQEFSDLEYVLKRQHGNSYVGQRLAAAENEEGKDDNDELSYHDQQFLHDDNPCLEERELLQEDHLYQPHQANCSPEYIKEQQFQSLGHVFENDKECKLQSPKILQLNSSTEEVVPSNSQENGVSKDDTEVSKMSSSLVYHHHDNQLNSTSHPYSHQHQSNCVDRDQVLLSEGSSLEVSQGIVSSSGLTSPFTSVVDTECANHCMENLDLIDHSQDRLEVSLDSDKSNCEQQSLLWKNLKEESLDEDRGDQDFLMESSLRLVDMQSNCSEAVDKEGGVMHVPAMLDHQENKIEEILSTLLGEAANFSPEGDEERDFVRDVEPQESLQMGASRNFTLSPETTSCDSLDVESEYSGGEPEGSLPSSGKVVSTMPVLEDGLSSGEESEMEVVENHNSKYFVSEDELAMKKSQQLFMEQQQHLYLQQQQQLQHDQQFIAETEEDELSQSDVERGRVIQRVRSLDEQLCRGEIPPMANSLGPPLNQIRTVSSIGSPPASLPSRTAVETLENGLFQNACINGSPPLTSNNFNEEILPHATSSPHIKASYRHSRSPTPHGIQSPSSSTLNLMKKQITEIEREIALKKPECGGHRKVGLEGEILPPSLDLHLLDPLNEKMGEPPPPPAPHPHRGSNNEVVENGSSTSTPGHTSTPTSSIVSPSRVIGHLHSPQFTPVSGPIAGPQLLSTMGSLTSPIQIVPHMVSGHPATHDLHHKPGNNGVSPSRESVEAAIADIKQAIRRTKNLPLKTHPQERQDKGPVWVPRNNRRDQPCSQHSSPSSPQLQTQPRSPQLTQSQQQQQQLLDSSPSGGSTRSRDRSLHEEEDGDTDQETDRLLGQQRSDDTSFLDEKSWSRLKSRTSMPRSLAGESKEPDSEGGGANSNESSPSTPSHHGSTNQMASSPHDLVPSNKIKAKKDKESGKKKGRSKEVMVHEPAVLIEGVLFRARYLGSTQLVSEGQPTKTTRMMQAEEAVSRIKDAQDEEEEVLMERPSITHSQSIPKTPQYPESIPSSPQPRLPPSDAQIFPPSPTSVNEPENRSTPGTDDFTTPFDADTSITLAQESPTKVTYVTPDTPPSLKYVTADTPPNPKYPTTEGQELLGFRDDVRKSKDESFSDMEDSIHNALELLDRRLDEELAAYEEEGDGRRVRKDSTEEGGGERSPLMSLMRSASDENIYVNVSNLSFTEEEIHNHGDLDESFEELDITPSRSLSFRLDDNDLLREDDDKHDGGDRKGSPSWLSPKDEASGKNHTQGNVAWIVDAGGGIGATGSVFHLRFVGSIEVQEDSADVEAVMRKGKRPRKEMVMEAVAKLKAPEGEAQPSTEVDLFISTEKIMVLNTDLKEIMMDHALRTISYIADIGDLVVLMARRRMLPTDDPTGNSSHRLPKMICHVFESDEAQFIAQSIGQAFQVAYLEFLKANGIEDHSFVKEMDYQEVLNSQEIFGDELQMFAKKELQKEVVVPKLKGEILGVVVVESGWGSMVPTVVIANLSPTGAAAKCGQLNIGDQIIAINGISLVGLPLSNCQNYIKNTKYNTAVKLTVVPCPPVVEVKIRRPDTKYQLGFSVQNGVICSLLRGGIAERGGVRVGHRIIDINSQSVVAVPHEKIVNLLATSVGEIRMKTMPTSIFRLLTGQETPQYI